MKKLFEQEITAIVPSYIKDKGNCTIVYRNNLEPLVLEKNIQTILRSMGKYYMIDLQEIKKRYRPYILSQNLVPIPFGRKDVFVPFKTRIPMYKNDGAFGYINMKYIDSIKPKSNVSFVYLIDGTIIKCLSRQNTINKHMRNGKIISRCYYEDRFMMVSEEKEKYNHHIPATKADIDIIKNQLLKLSRE